MQWVRLMLPLKLGDDLLGYWLFGRRDPDDIYSQVEIPILQSLADQTAITLSNIIKTERLRVAYKEDIDRFEEERSRFALELHDNILNELAAIWMKLDDRSLTPAFQIAYNEVIKHLRDIVRDLKPAILTYGLERAVQRLADNLMEQSGDKVRITVHFETDESSYPEDAERHIFRIMQEACANALRHAKPTEITITGKLTSQVINIEVQDNGIGFDLHEKLNLNTLELNRHFGLKGIFERAELVGADVKIESVLTKGTRVEVRWKPVQHS
jgi:signal transduction histidine kinase